jgi:hypothetical protein
MGEEKKARSWLEHEEHSLRERIVENKDESSEQHQSDKHNRGVVYDLR